MRSLLPAAALLLALAQSAAAQPAGRQPAGAPDTRTLHIALREDADSLDPTLSRTDAGRLVLTNLCQGLFSYDDKLAIVPELARGYEWTDSRTLTVYLREGVTFQDGTALDAAAVKFSIERHAALPGSARAAELADLAHVETLSPHVVRFVLKAPSAVFLSRLALRAGVLVSPTAAEAEGKDFGAHPVCAGPYRFAERVAQDHITLERDPNFADAARYSFDKVIFRVLVAPAARLANLRSGAIDMAENIAAADAEAVRKDPKLRLVVSGGLGYQGLTINLGNGKRADTPLGHDARVRRALELSIDRAAISHVVFAGMYPPTAQPVPPSSPFYAKNVPPPGRDVAAARALLAEAGVKPPVPVSILLANSPEAQQVGSTIQSMAAEAGFEVKLAPMEPAAALQAARRGDFQAYLTAWSGRPDPDSNVRDLLRSDAPDNVGRYNSPEFDALIDEAAGTQGLDARRALYAKVFARLHDDLPIIYLYTPGNIVGMSARVQGFVPVADGMIRLAGVTLTP
jgi:peptide/nickel transport system substrate-binding protein